MKNFKKKFLSAMLACLMLSPCAASFAACENGSGNPSDSGNAGAQHEHTWSANFSYNDSKHYKICSGCNEKSEEGEHTYGTDGYTCTVCGYENEARKPAQKQSAADYFGGVKASYLRGNITDADGTAKSFNEILDRQIDLLAQDVLYRLTYVYGYNQTTHNRTQNAKFTLKNGEKNFSYQGNNAVVNSNTLLAAKQESVTELTSANITVITDFQKSIQILPNEVNYFAVDSCLNLTGAIEGRNMVVKKLRANMWLLVSSVNDEKIWKWGEGLTKSTYEDLATESNVNAMKAAIAQTLAGETVNGNFATYQTTLAKISALGYGNFDSAKLVNFIKSNVIGEALVNKDDSYGKEIETKYNGIIDDDSLDLIDTAASYDANNLCYDSPRLYKGYSMVLPAIVSQAIGNTFENTTQKIYPAMNRYAVQSFETLNGANTPQKYASIVLMPKTEISATKLALKIKGANNIGVKCEINGESVQVAASNDGELLLIDLHAYAKKIGAYNGGKENDTSLDLFGNSGAGAAGINNGAHYIKLIFENPNGGKFSVEIDGYYNK